MKWICLLYYLKPMHFGLFGKLDYIVLNKLESCLLCYQVLSTTLYQPYPYNMFGEEDWIGLDFIREGKKNSNLVNHVVNVKYCTLNMLLVFMFN